MKHVFLILSYFISTTVFAQTEEIYRLTFSDKSNFKLTTFFDHKIPEVFLVIDTTEVWNSNRFWLKDFDNNQKKKVVKKIQNDEHHPYFFSYLFSDTALDKLIDDRTKKELSINSKSIKSKHISPNASNYRTLSSSKDIKGYYFVTSEPFFSDNGSFAFIDLRVYYKDSYKQPANEAYFGSICIVFRKEGGMWKKIAKKDWLIL